MGAARSALHARTHVSRCVEDATTVQVLCDVRVDWEQGHYFSKPAMASGEMVE